MKLLRRRQVVIGLAAVVVLVLIAVGTSLIHDNSKHTKKHQHGSNSSPATAVVEITPNGFMPQTVAVKPSTDVVWVNEDTMPHLPAADPYPTHAELPSLVAPRALGYKETYTYLFTKAGTVHYHDDLHPTLTGEIEVQ